MANPLARVVMNNIAQKSGMVEKKSYYSTQTNTDNSSSSNNLDRKESQLLSSLLNSKKSTTSGTSSSHNKSTYGRTTNVSNVSANTMKTLDSLVSKANSSGHTSTSTSNQQKKDSCGIDKSRPDLRSLCSLDNISIGKTNVEKDDRNVMKRLDLNQLVDSNIKTNKRQEKVSYGNKQTSGMTTLGELAREKTKNSQHNDSKSSKTDTITTSNSYVKSNVINNLEAYIPKVTLESIGKKGSLF